LKLLVLGLGNPLLADDAVGALAARALEPRLAGRADVCATSLHGLALLDVLDGYDGAVLLDAVVSGTRPVGDVYEIDPASLDCLSGFSPHYAGVPELLAVARRLELRFPRRLRILAVEVRDPWTVGGEMSGEVRAAVPELCDRACRAVAEIAA
jgi:hydrogenase maturation protease